MTATMSSQTPEDTSPALPSLAEATLTWARIGLLSFGGPAGQIALMHRIVVEEKRWVGEERFLHALNYCMLLPGPEAQQLAVYLGWLMHRTLGGLIAGLLFVLPGALVMLGLSAIYAVYSDMPVLNAVFFGIKAAVVGIVLQALLRIARRSLKNGVMIALAACAFVAIYIFNVPFPLIILAAGVFGWVGSRVWPDIFSLSGKKGAQTAGPPGLVDLMHARGELAHTEPSAGRVVRTLLIWIPLWLGPVLLLWLLMPATVWSQIAVFFTTMSVVTFGGAYAVLSYVAQAAVQTYGWVSPQEMIDGLGLAETTPGPLILVLQFIGFLAAFRAPGALDPVVAGIVGSLVTLWVTFAPCFFWIFLGAPYMEKLRGHAAASAAMTAITAAVVGVIANLALWFALHVVFRETFRIGEIGPMLPVPDSMDWRAVLLVALGMVLLFRFNAGVLTVLGISAFGGLLFSMF